MFIGIIKDNTAAARKQLRDGCQEKFKHIFGQIVGDAQQAAEADYTWVKSTAVQQPFLQVLFVEIE
ncbi:hypothetical protein D3C86_2107380 [compost metagenome]